MGRHNKSAKERKAKSREEKEAKAAEEKKLLETSNNVAGMEPSSVSPPAEVSAATSASLISSSDRISTSVGAISNNPEFVQASEDARPQVTVSCLINEKRKESGVENGGGAEGGRAHPGKGWENGTVANGSCLRNEKGKESGVGNGGDAEGGRAQPVRAWGNGTVAEGGRAQPVKGWGKESIAEGSWAQSVKGGDVLGKASSVVRLQPSGIEARQKPRVDASNPVANKNYGGGYSGQNRSGGWGDSRTAGNGRDGVREGYGHQTSVSRVDESTRNYSLGRLLSSILRHRAGELGLNMRSDGYVFIHDLLNLHSKTYAGLPLSSYTVDDIKEALRLDNKQRFGLREENGQLLIRANQGHSVQMVKSEDLLSPVYSPEEVPVCVHGTYLEYLDAIKKQGLKRMNRHHIHFATGLFKDKRVTSGMRSDCEVLIYLNVQEYLKDGMKLYRSENGVILAEGKNGVIPPKYFAKIERRR